MGLLMIIYYASGGVLTGVLYQFYRCYTDKTSWNNQNLVVDNQVVKRNVVGFICFCMMYMMV